MPDRCRQFGRGRRVATTVAAGALLLGLVRASSAQSLSRVSLDSVGAMDLFKGEGTTGHPGASIDISSVIRVGGGWSVHLRPWFFKSSANGSTWSREMYQAAARYERPGRVALRVDAGYIASPIGLGMLDMRADINPTILPHMGYMVPMLPFDPNAPSMPAIAASYPLGANITVSGLRWDARVALVNSSPTRRYALNATAGNPDQTPVLIAGGGVTPRAGLRFGGSFASGRYATDDELKTADGLARDLRMATVEAEYAFGYTKLAGEFTHERFVHGSRTATASTWFVQGMQTLTPRWFAAARLERVSAPPLPFPGARRTSFALAETTLAYRLTPELMLRSSVTLQRFYTASRPDRRLGAQIVWSRRWW